MRVTPTNTPQVEKLRMSLIARAMIYTGVNLRKTELRKKAAHTRILPSKPAVARTVQEKDSRTTRSTVRGGSWNDYIAPWFFSSRLNICKWNEVNWVTAMHHNDCSLHFWQPYNPLLTLE